MEQGITAKLHEEHTVKMLKAMLHAKPLDCKRDKKESMLCPHNSLGKNQVAKIGHLKTKACIVFAAIKFHHWQMAIWGLKELFWKAHTHTTHTYTHTCTYAHMHTH